MKLLSVSDLSARWIYTRAGIHKLLKTNDFPLPISIVNQGKIKLFDIKDIEAYEQNKPWLFNKEEKIKRQRFNNVAISS